MSYDVFFWDYSEVNAPASFVEAIAQIKTLSSKPRPTDSRLPAFACLIESLLTGPDQEPSVRRQFEGFSRAVDDGGAVLTVNLPMDDRLPVFRLLVDTAMAQGLAVFDDQIGLLFLPDGQVLPEEGRGAWDDIKRELDNADAEELPRSLSAFKKRCEDNLAALLIPLGFIKKMRPGSDAPVFTRMGEQGIHQRLSTSYRGSYPYYNVTVFLAVRCDKAAEVFAQAGFGEFSYTVITRLSSVSGCPEEVSSPSTYKELLSAVRHHAIPFFEEGKTLKGLDRLLNADINEKVKQDQRTTLAMPNCLIVAWLAGNQYLDAVIAELDEAALNVWRIGPEIIENVRKENMERHEKWNRLKHYIKTTERPINL